MATLSPLESKARDLIEASRDLDSHATFIDWSTSQAVRLVFLACWSQSLTATRVREIAIALGGSPISPDQLHTTLVRLIRQRTLRSRTEGGLRLYEVAL